MIDTFTGSIQTIGKAPLADLKSGLATAPTLFAAMEFPEQLNPLIARKFDGPGDVEEALAIVRKSNGLERTKILAYVHAELAIEYIEKEFRNSEAKEALIALACRVVTRTT